MNHAPEWGRRRPRVGRSHGHAWGIPMAIRGDVQWPPMGRMAWPSSQAQGRGLRSRRADRAAGRRCPPHDANRRLVKHVSNEADALITFLTDPDVDHLATRSHEPEQPLAELWGVLPSCHADLPIGTAASTSSNPTPRKPVHTRASSPRHRSRTPDRPLTRCSSLRRMLVPWAVHGDHAGSGCWRRYLSVSCSWPGAREPRARRGRRRVAGRRRRPAPHPRPP